MLSWLRRPVFSVCELRRLDVKPGDVLVLRSQDYISKSAAARIQGIWKESGLPDVKLIILDAGVSLEVLRKETPT